MSSKELIISQTKKWITDVVAGCNFCPFAARELKRGSIHYEVLFPSDFESTFIALSKCFDQLNNDSSIETTLLILPDESLSFELYLELLEQSQLMLENDGYEGVYQLASFHPDYLFEGSDADDAANYTNRSPYPMLHILREESVTTAIENHPGTEKIPQRNIEFARKKGLAHMQLLRELCMRTS